jgi:hypothetical protein
MSGFGEKSPVVVKDEEPWSDFVSRLAVADASELATQRQRLGQAVKQDPHWQDQLKLAMVIMSDSSGAVQGDEVSKLLRSVKDTADASQPAQAWASWLLKLNHQSSQVARRLQVQHDLIEELNQKLQALSSIEQKLEKRGRQGLK